MNDESGLNIQMISSQIPGSQSLLSCFISILTRFQVFVKLIAVLGKCFTIHLLAWTDL